MPQMFPMNWWLLALLPAIIIIINMTQLTFNKSTIIDKKTQIKKMTKTQNWKW